MSKLNEIEEQIERERIDAKRVFDLAHEQPFPFNENYRLGVGDAHLRQLGEFANAVNATTFDVRYWYANGPVCEDRPNVLAVFHPVIHKRDGEWKHIYALAKSLAIELKRWIWLTEGEDRWVRIMVGHDPRGHGDEEQNTGPLYNAEGKYQNDQFITTLGPNGEEHFVGCS